MKNRIHRLLFSRSTALALTATIAALCLIGVNIPQLAEVSPQSYVLWREGHPVAAPVVEAFGFHRMYRSTIFLCSVILLIVVMSITLIRMTLSVQKRVSKNVVPFDDKFFKHFISFEAASISVKDTAIKKAGRLGYMAKKISPNVISFIKNSPGGWGTVVLHLGLIVVMISGLSSFLFQNRGFIQLLEKDTFFGNNPDFLVQEAGPLAKSFEPDVFISLQKCTPRYYPDGQISSLESRVIIGSPDKTPEPTIIGINEPYETGEIKIYQSTTFGYTVGMELKSDDEKILAFFSLNHPEKPHQPFTGLSDYPNSPYVISMELTPDPEQKPFKNINPIMKIEITEDHKIVYTGNIKPGDQINLGKKSLRFADIRRWSGFIIKNDISVVSIFIGFMITLMGLILIYFFPRREIYMSMEETYSGFLIKFGGVSLREKALFQEEFRYLTESIYLDEGTLYVGAELVSL